MGLCEWVAATCFVCLVAGALVRQAIGLGNGFWLTDPWLYVRHGQHMQPASGLLGMGIIAAGAGLVLVTHMVASENLESSGLLRAAVGIGVGGMLANAVELLLSGSVTDFIGVHTSGVWSAGDTARLIRFDWICRPG